MRPVQGRLYRVSLIAETLPEPVNEPAAPSGGFAMP